MSYAGATGQPPTPNSESTAIEVRRLEGSVHSYPCNQAVTAGNLVKGAASGVIYTVGTEDASVLLGVVFYTTTSGQRAVYGKGQVRCYWDGVGTPAIGSEIQMSATQSGWFTAIVSGGVGYGIGRYDPLPGGGALGAAQSGTLQVITIP
jgi:hypothetical protein